MARARTAQTIEDIISDAIGRIVARTVDSIEKAIATRVAAEVERSAKPRSQRRAAPAKRRRARPVELTKWVADRRARRVPLFVIEMTGGLDTKKKIVAKFGPNAVFEKGKPLPAAVVQMPKAEKADAGAPRVVKAKPPVVRKAAAR